MPKQIVQSLFGPGVVVTGILALFAIQLALLDTSSASQMNVFHFTINTDHAMDKFS